MVQKSIMQVINEGYENVWKAFIKPERYDYDIGQMGPPVYISKNSSMMHRTDFYVLNKLRLKLQCSIYLPDGLDPERDRIPCIVYLHSQSGCRLEGLSLRDYCADRNYALCLFDFAACGMSEGEYVSLGWNEKDDLGLVIDEVRSVYGLNHFCLWGRSMGAVTAILYTESCSEQVEGNYKISCLVLDSPFTNINTMAQDIADKQTNVPNMFVKLAMRVVKSTIQSKLNFNIDELQPIDSVRKLRLPMIFHVGLKDVIVKPSRVRDEFYSAAGPNLKHVFFSADAEHGSERDTEFHERCFMYLDRIIQTENMSVPRESVQLHGDPDTGNMNVIFDRTLLHKYDMENNYFEAPRDYQYQARPNELKAVDTSSHPSHHRNVQNRLIGDGRIPGPVLLESKPEIEYQDPRAITKQGPTIFHDRKKSTDGQISFISNWVPAKAMNDYGQSDPQSRDKMDSTGVGGSSKTGSSVQASSMLDSSKVHFGQKRYEQLLYEEAKKAARLDKGPQYNKFNAIVDPKREQKPIYTKPLLNPNRLKRPDIFDTSQPLKRLDDYTALRKAGTKPANAHHHRHGKEDHPSTWTKQIPYSNNLFEFQPHVEAQSHQHDEHNQQ